MTKNSHINWTDHTANFWWGCFKVSEGCKNCYAETLSKRYGHNIWGPTQTTQREYKKAIWQDLLKWDKEAEQEGIRRRVFVQSMSDFLEDHPMVKEWRKQAMGLMENLKWLDILILTKRPENYLLMSDWLPVFPDHIWMGASVENQERADWRVSQVAQIPCKTHFLSVEPMLEKIDLNLRGRNYGRDFPEWSEDIDWVICGGESGVKCRPFEWDWARDLRDQCHEADVAFWMKQGGGHPNKREALTDIPEDLRIRELPERVIA